MCVCLIWSEFWKWGERTLIEGLLWEKAYISSLYFLLSRLWHSLETDTSNMAPSCVGLLLTCVDYMATNLDEEEKEEEEEEVCFW